MPAAPLVVGSRLGLDLRSLGSTSTEEGFRDTDQHWRVGRGPPAFASPPPLGLFPFIKGLRGYQLPFSAQTPWPICHLIQPPQSGHSPFLLVLRSQSRVVDTNMPLRATVGNRPRHGGGAGTAHTPIQTQGQRQMTGLLTVPCHSALLGLTQSCTDPAWPSAWRGQRGKPQNSLSPKRAWAVSPELPLGALLPLNITDTDT